MRVSIIIPTYNEEKRIGITLKEYSEYFDNLVKQKKLAYELVVVINNSNDKTEEIVKKISLQNKNIRYLNFKEGGKGFAVIEGFKDSLKRENDSIGFIDADMATNPEEFYKLIKKATKYDGAIASRYKKGAVILPPPTLMRLIAKRLFNNVVRSILFLPYKDTQCGAKIFGREVIEEILASLTMSNWAFDVDLLYNAKKKGFKIAEVPTRWVNKSYSKIRFWRTGPWMVLGVIRLRIINSLFKNLIGFYDGFNKIVRKIMA